MLERIQDMIKALELVVISKDEVFTSKMKVHALQAQVELMKLELAILEKI